MDEVFLLKRAETTTNRFVVKIYITINSLYMNLDSSNLRELARKNKSGTQKSKPIKFLGLLRKLQKRGSKFPRALRNFYEGVENSIFFEISKIFDKIRSLATGSRKFSKFHRLPRARAQK